MLAAAAHGHAEIRLSNITLVFKISCTRCVGVGQGFNNLLGTQHHAQL